MTSSRAIVNVGENLRAHRRVLGLSQEAFAERFEVHRTYMGGLERGERTLTLRAVERMATRLGVEPMTLLRPAKKD
jgi:transcriptional regulator with XRE-family HTH domain